MNFLNMPGFKIFYYLILVIGLIAIFKWLITSAIESMKRSGGKISSIYDEIFMAVLIVACFIVIGQLEPSVVINFLLNPIKWAWGIFLEILRFVGIQI